MARDIATRLPHVGSLEGAQVTPKMLNTGVVMEDAQAVEYRKQGNGIPSGAYFFQNSTTTIEPWTSPVS
ncbi:hypothetical protein VCV18_004216 [Metarhizium anisopliae]